MRRLWWHLTGQSWMWQRLLGCPFGRHRYVEWTLVEWPARTASKYVACAVPGCRKKPTP